jgi:hypothetical protein
VSESDDRGVPVRIRRAPKFGVFVVLGAVLGIIVSFILTAGFPIQESVGFAATFGYFAIYGLVGGILVGCIVAIIFDRVLARRAKTVAATRDVLQPAPDDPGDQ